MHSSKLFDLELLFNNPSSWDVSPTERVSQGICSEHPTDLLLVPCSLITKMMFQLYWNSAPSLCDTRSQQFRHSTLPPIVYLMHIKENETLKMFHYLFYLNKR
mmetsp:Transcript_27154/g.58177  ORF Transcript_27154/g.58177 Transcript_27154/m.58177 type:complete len:103 (+) Transcript_27154:1987-2295(+)